MKQTKEEIEQEYLNIRDIASSKYLNIINIPEQRLAKIKEITYEQYRKMKHLAYLEFINNQNSSWRQITKKLKLTKDETIQFVKVKQKLIDEYHKTVDAALVKFNEIKEPAYAEYLLTRQAARETRKAKLERLILK